MKGNAAYRALQIMALGFVVFLSLLCALVVGLGT